MILKNETLDEAKNGVGSVPKTEGKPSNRLFYAEQLLDKSGGNKFILARMVMIRALEIDSGRKALVESVASDKPTSIALREVLRGMVSLSGKKKDKERIAE